MMNIRKRQISSKITLLDALKLMDEIDKKLLIVVDNDLFVGLISAGDIQRAIIQNKSLETPVIEVLRKNIKIGRPEDSLDSIKQMMFEYRMELCPVVNNDSEIVELYFWEDLYQDKKISPLKPFKLPVVIMAGGLGSRLRPLTNVLPKPLIPIGDKTILEKICDSFYNHGCDKFYISVNYKADLIEYFVSRLELPYSIEFFREEKPMGTAGSLSLLYDKFDQTFFVSNCDILIEQDYSEILQYHQSNNNEITMVAALKHFPIPYGVIETGENGQLIEIREKPELTFKINSGMYILEPHLLNEIPKKTYYHITNLIEKLIRQKRRVGVFPISEKSWKDIGDNKYLQKILK